MSKSDSDTRFSTANNGDLILQIKVTFFAIIYLTNSQKCINVHNSIYSKQKEKPSVKFLIMQCLCLCWFFMGLKKII